MKLRVLPGNIRVERYSGEIQQFEFLIRNTLNFDQFQIIMPQIHTYRHCFSNGDRNAEQIFQTMADRSLCAVYGNGILRRFVVANQVE